MCVILFQPETHFFLGNLLFAKSNLSGAIYHYEEALSQNAVHKDAFSSLRIIKCYQVWWIDQYFIDSIPSVLSGDGVGQGAVKSDIYCKDSWTLNRYLHFLKTARERLGEMLQRFMCVALSW